MLCAKYDYKMDIAVKQEEAFAKGVQKRTLERSKEDIQRPKRDSLN